MTSTEALSQKIRDLARERNAVILAHNYTHAEVQDVADFVGDSLQLSIEARDAKASAIVFCGVRFMAETAKILSPAATVLHPVPSSGCPMADMAPADKVAEWKRLHPDHVLVAYVNSTAAVKALVDVCCTSANAERIVRSIPADRPILFLPDQNLGANVMAATGRRMDLWPGCCPTHNRITPEMARAARAAHPDAEFVCHPECLPSVVALADAALSTGGMLRHVRESPSREFIVGTENGIFHRMRKEAPDKVLHPLEPLPTCPNMKKIYLEDVLRALETMSPTVELDPALMDRARAPIERMLALSK